MPRPREGQSERFRPHPTVTAGLGTLLLAASPVLASGGGMSTGDVGQAVATIVVFLVLLAVLGRWAWKPVVTQLRQREKDIADALNKARLDEKNAGDLLAMYQAQLAQSQAAAQDLLIEARKESADVRRQMLEVARAEAEQAAQQGRQEIEQAKKQALGELREATAELATDIAGRLIKREMTPQDHARLVKDSFEEIRKQAEGD